MGKVGILGSLIAAASFLIPCFPGPSAADETSATEPTSAQLSPEEKRIEDEARKIAPGYSSEHEVAESISGAKDAIPAGEALYRNGDYPRALERFQTARQHDPSDPRSALLLGLAYLRLDDPGQAAAQWAEYLKNAKDERVAADVSKFLTILLHEENVRSAQAAISEEKKLSMLGNDPKTVAIPAFRNLGSAEYAPLGKAFAAMLIDNLSALPEVRVLERDQVETLVAEANLGATNLVEKGTAVRAGKLLRAGRVVPASYVDWTASPTHLKTEAAVYDVDSANEVATAKAEVLLADFHQLIPKIATDLAAVIGRPVATLEPKAAEQVRESHTRSLPAVLAFGRALDAADRQDADSAQRACKEAEKEDPNFKLAKRFCGFLPPVWLSQQGIAAAIESQVLVTAPSFAAGAAPWIAGALIAGGAAGGAVAATSGGGGGGGGGSGSQVTNTSGGNNPPGLNGVLSNASVTPGDTLGMNITSQDPDGQTVTLSAKNLPSNSSFNQTSGAMTTGRFAFSPSCGQANQSFGPTFCATDSAGASTCQTSQIHVRACPPPTSVPPQATATPTPTPTPCAGLDDFCFDIPCCSGLTCNGETCDTAGPM